MLTPLHLDLKDTIPERWQCWEALDQIPLISDRLERLDHHLGLPDEQARDPQDRLTLRLMERPPEHLQ